MAPEYVVDSLTLFLSHKTIEFLTDRKFDAFHQILRYSQDSFYSSQYARSQSASFFFAKASRSAFRIGERAYSYEKSVIKTGKENSYINIFDKKETEVKEEEKFPYDTAFKDIILKHNGTLFSPRKNGLAKLLRRMGFVVSAFPTGIEFYGWKIPRSIRYSDRFLSIFHGLAMAEAMKGEKNSIQITIRLKGSPKKDADDHKLERDLIHSAENIKITIREAEPFIIPNFLVGGVSDFSLSGILNRIPTEDRCKP